MVQFVTVPNPLLRQKSKPARQIDGRTQRLIKDLKKALVQAKDPPGVGLSAVQINQPVRIFLARKDIKSKPRVFINPEIDWQSKKLANNLEGCLSVPGYHGLVQRHEAIKLHWQMANGGWRTEKFSGFLATVIQHELDHLNGILFIDRVLAQGNKIYRIEKDKLVETVL